MAEILVVDDNEDNRKVMLRLLQHAGHTGFSAANGAAAITAALARRPALVLMDLAMPEMDGWAATAGFKADPELADIPIIVVTGHLTSDEIRRAQAVGCQDVVSKPIDYYVLVAKINRFLTSTAAPSGPATGTAVTAGASGACPA